ncbi:protein aurora borealis [Diretmus argenteus]
MGDHVELQITPETPGRPSIRNPFESPNDYHHLREPLVPSPSIFKSKPCKATPVEFNWSIDEMASLLPVHIDPEDIQRQSLYLSQTRTDSEIEEKRQNAIEQFFTKGAIVPSPWASSDTWKATKIHDQKIACQTDLSLPVTFDLEKILGEYYRCEDACQAFQESLSSSSLRRKLFLDGQGSMNSGSDNSSPPSPERGSGPPLPKVVGGSEGEVLSSIFASPLSCGMEALTPSTGQFSSSPIQQGRVRDCSLGSIPSPLFSDRSPAGFASPSLSPIGPQAARTPIGSGERKQLSFMTPDGVDVPLDMDVNSCTESPYVEGCSPIRSCSPHQLHCHNEQLNARSKPRSRAHCWSSLPLISPILNPKLQDDPEHEDQLPNMELDPSPLSARDVLPGIVEPCLGLDRLNEGVGLGFLKPLKMEEGKETRMEGRLEDIAEGEEEEEEEEEEESGGPSAQLTSSRMCNVSAEDSAHIFVSLLAEGSSIRYDSSMQVDSGYNTTSAGTASLIDGLISDCHSKELFSPNPAEEAFPFSRHTKVKAFYPHH